MEENIKKLIDECLNCKNPTCVEGCPAKNNIPLFIKYFLVYPQKHLNFVKSFLFCFSDTAL